MREFAPRVAKTGSVHAGKHPCNPMRFWAISPGILNARHDASQIYMTVGDHLRLSAPPATRDSQRPCCEMPTDAVAILGVDFSSAPSQKKPITLAHARLLSPTMLRVEALEAIGSLPEFAQMLCRPGPWLGGFDFPFGLPRELVLEAGWPTDWPALVRAFSATPRPRLRETLRAFCAGRPAGAKFAHRATDRPAGSSPSMKWVNPPVAWMFHAGAPALLEAGVELPGLHAGDPSRVALEAYPGLLARALHRGSYKSDDPARQDAARHAARRAMVGALAAGAHPLAIQVDFAGGVRRQIEDEPRGDWLDAVLCAVQAGWALTQGARYGLPERVDGLEGWIVSAPATTG